MADGNCLILFVKAPVSGAVKTRLAPRLGKDGTLALYRRMLRRQIALVNGYRNVSRQLWVAGSKRCNEFGDFTGDIHEQQGDDIGERMCHALQQALASHSCAVLIGCDCPEIDPAYLDSAFAALAEGHDAVLGPAVDGGYILAGLRRCDEKLFSGIDWGSAHVMKQTRARLAAGGFAWKELAPLHDIDDPEDLDSLSGLIAREYGV